MYFLQHLDTIIKFIAYTLFLFGIWLLVSPIIVHSVKKGIYNSRFRIASKTFNEPIKTKNRFINYIEMLLSITINTKKPFAVYSFFALSFMLFFITFIILFTKIESKLLAFSFSIFSGLFPFMALFLKLNNMQLEGSYEGEQLIIELSNQYKINNFNMIEAIDKTIPYMKDNPYSSKALLRLSLAIKEYRNINELNNAIKEFVLNYNTEWAQMLGMNIFIAISEGIDVSNSLDDIMDELKIIKSLIEKNKRYNNETFALIKYVIPITYIFTIYLATTYFNFSLKKFFDYQFRTDIGLKFGTLTFFFMGLNFVILYLLRKPKYDF